MIKRFLITHKVILGSAVFIVLSALFIGSVLLKTSKDKSYTYKIETRNSDYENLYDEKAQEDKPVTDSPGSTPTTTQKTPNPTTSQQNPQSVASDPCGSLKYAFMSLESDYLRLTNEYIRIIYDELIERWAASEERYHDEIDTVVEARAYSQTLLDNKWGEVNSAYTKQETQQCGGIREFERYALPDIVGQSPTVWFNQSDVNYNNSFL